MQIVKKLILSLYLQIRSSSTMDENWLDS